MSAESQPEASAEAGSGRESPAPDPLRLIDSADKNMALKHWEQAADEYAQALDQLRESHDEDAPELAPILHRYGRSLLEHAIATSGALGGGGQQEAPMPSRKKSQKQSGAEASSSASSSSKPTSDPRFSFSGDADDDEEEEDDDEADGNAQAQGGEEGEEEDADDLSVAFSVLDLARLIYHKILHPSEGSAEPARLETLQGTVWNSVRIKNELAEVLNDLGDVGLESENFQQASSDYHASLQLLSPLLQPHSRRLADAYLRLGLALEFHPEPSQQATASKHVESAANALRQRLAALESREQVLKQAGGSAGDAEARAQAAAAEVREEKATLESAGPASSGGGTDGDAAESKGKGKGKASIPEAVEEEQGPAERDDVADMDDVRVERELKDVREMVAELDAKIEDIKANAAAGNAGTSIQPSGEGTAAGPSADGFSGSTVAASTKAALQQAINDAFLGASTNALAPGRGPTGPVNDLSAMVRKKKRPADAEAGPAPSSVPAPEGTAQQTASDEAGDSVEATASETKRARVEDA
ncbi:unnamed protein product [Parajaminaea phylloscopi]